MTTSRLCSAPASALSVRRFHPQCQDVTATNGILSVQFDPALGQGWVEHDAHQVTRRQVQRRSRHLGYRPLGTDLCRWIAAQRPLLLSLMAGILWLSGWIGPRPLHYTPT